MKQGKIFPEAVKNANSILNKKEWNIQYKLKYFLPRSFFDKIVVGQHDKTRRKHA